MARWETAKAASHIHGDELYHERARAALPLLVRQAKAGEPITYGSLPKELGMPNARNLNRPLGSIGTSLKQLSKEWNRPIPQIQALVVNKNTRLPGPGIDELLDDSKTDFSGRSPKQRRERVKDEQSKVYDYRRWDDVLRALKLNPVTDDTTDGPDEAARIANNEILGYLAGIPYDHDDRTPSDLSRYGRFVVGWGEAVRGERYTEHILRSLTWENLGFRFGQRFGNRSEKEIEQVWAVLTSHYERACETGAVVLAEEIDSPTPVEGAVKTVTVNAYERNPKARKQCLDAHGAGCVVCGFNFGKQYGLVAEGYIHVHHLRPLSEIKASHKVDPKEDFSPVCPNCHAVIHLKKTPFTLEEVRAMLARSAGRDRAV